MTFVNRLQFKTEFVRKVHIALFLIFSFWFVSLNAQLNTNISGENNAVYIFRTAQDSLNHHFENEISFRVDHRNFTFGMTFLAELPAYDDTRAIQELGPNDINTEWVDRFIQVNYENLRVTAGTIEEVFGSGLTLRTWHDKDLNHDKRLEGVQMHYNYENLKVAGVYGALTKTVGKVFERDLVIGMDVEFKPISSMTLGASAVQYKNRNAFNLRRDYIHNNIFGGRISMMLDSFDFRAEYAELIRTHNRPAPLTGTAFFTTANVYLGDFTFGGGYKRYNRYVTEYPLSDLPSLNNYGELLATMSVSDLNLEEDFEEGLMGELIYTPNMDNEIKINYSESWNRNFQARYSNLFFEYKRHFDSFSASVEYEHIERIAKSLSIWEKELRPAVIFDFYDLVRPLEVKFLWAYVTEEYFDVGQSRHKPYFQVDTSIIDNLSISVFAEYEFTGSDDFGKNSVFMGGELVTSISRHTEIKLFIGKEKGGKVCRNGVCFYQAPFEGLKLSIITKF
jgi:hypothetical protein